MPCKFNVPNCNGIGSLGYVCIKCKGSRFESGSSSPSTSMPISMAASARPAVAESSRPLIKKMPSMTKGAANINDLGKSATVAKLDLGSSSSASPKISSAAVPNNNEIFKIGEWQAGTKIGEGSYKGAYSITGYGNHVMIISENGRALEKEMGILDELRRNGIRTVEVLSSVTEFGGNKFGVVLEHLKPGGVDVKEIKATKLGLTSNQAAVHAYATQFGLDKLIAQLATVKEYIAKYGAIGDLQFVFSGAKGAVLFDPLALKGSAKEDFGLDELLSFLLKKKQGSQEQGLAAKANVGSSVG